MRATLLIGVLASIGLAGCQSAGSGAPPVAGPTSAPGAATPAETRTSPIPTGSALGGVLGGPVGASLTDDDRAAAWNAQIAALNSGQRRSWRGDHGVFGLVEPGQPTGGGCRAYSQTIYIAGRPAHGRGVGCKQPDGSWKMTS